MGREMPASYYDNVYASSPLYKAPAHATRWTPIWNAIAAEVPSDMTVVDLGCGPGHLGELLPDSNYIGVDFSTKALSMASSRVPEGEFILGDLLSIPIPEGDIYVISETLEHIEDDLGLLERLPKGKPIIVSVPTFVDPAHVRWFRSLGEVKLRYSKYVTIADIWRVMDWFVFRGILNGSNYSRTFPEGIQETTS